MSNHSSSFSCLSCVFSVDLSYMFHFWDGAVIPIGLGLSLILNGIFLAAKINAEKNVLTLPDVLARRYGKVVEVLVSFASIVSFLMLLAGNLVGMGKCGKTFRVPHCGGFAESEVRIFRSPQPLLLLLFHVFPASSTGIITAYVWGTSIKLGIWISAIIVWMYTVSGGLFSVAYTDVVQGAVGWCVFKPLYIFILLFIVHLCSHSYSHFRQNFRTGCIVCAYWLIANADEEAPPPSVGFPGYVYPNQEICDMYNGVPCTNVEDACCYNTELYCNDVDDPSTCSPIDNGAYPVGDQRVFNDQMSDPQALTPFPNAILWNW